MNAPRNQSASREARPCQWSIQVYAENDTAIVDSGTTADLTCTPTPHFQACDFHLRGDGNCQHLKISFPPRRLAIRLQQAEILQKATDRFPLWRCNALTNFQGLIWPRKPEHHQLDRALLLLTSERNRSVTLLPDPSIPFPFVLRLTLAVEEQLSEPFLSSLEAHFRQAQADQQDAHARQAQEGRELAATIHRLECDLQIVHDSKLWRLTVAGRQLRVQVVRFLKRSIKWAIRPLIPRR